MREMNTRYGNKNSKNEGGEGNTKEREQVRKAQGRQQGEVKGL